MSNRPITPGGAFEGGVLPPTNTAALTKFIRSLGDTQYAARLVTIDGETRTVAEWLTQLSLETGGVGDNIPPSVVSGTVDGSTVSVVFSEAVQAANTAGLTVEINNVAVAVTDIAGNGTNTLIMALAAAAVYGNAVTFNYDPARAQPGQGLRDLVGNVLGLVQNFGLTNVTIPVAPYTADFVADTYDGVSISDLSVTRSSAGYHPGTSGTYWEFGPNTLRRTNLGLLVEPSATNLHPNPTLTGGAAGNLATTGLLPTGLEFGGVDNGRMVVTMNGTGTEFGLPYFELSITATGADDAYINLTAATAINGVLGETFTSSMFVRLVSGTWPAGATIRPTMAERTSAGATIAAAGTVNPITPTTTLQRGYATRTFNQATAAKAFSWFGIQTVGAISGAVVLRFYIPNIVKSALLTSPIKGTAVSGSSPTVTTLPAPSGTVTFPAYNSSVQKNDVPIWYGDQRWVIDSPFKSYSAASSDGNDIRFEIRAGEMYDDPGTYSDVPDNVQRCQAQNTGTSRWTVATDMYINQEFMVEDNGTINAARWLLYGGQHGIGYGQSWSAPFEIGMRGEKLVITANYETGNGDTVRSLIYRDAWLSPANIVRGAYNRFEVFMRHGWNGGGILKVRVNGVEVVNIGAGATTPDRIGFAKQTHWTWKFGIYRGMTAETFVLHARNHKMVTGTPALAAYNAGGGGTGSMTRTADVLTPTGDLAAKINAATLLQVDTGAGLTTVTKPQLATIWNGSNTLLKKLVITP